jgi:thymidylate synthase (FAD)
MPRVQAKVTLVRATPDADRLVASAAKLCYAGDAATVWGDGGDAESFVERLADMGHMSPLEHASFTFYIEGVSRAMTHQLVRHRIASYSQRSQRYVAHDAFDYVAPPRLEGRTVRDGDREVDAVAYFAETMDLLAERYGKLNEALGGAREDARYVLPNACETKIVATMNARELLHFLAERLCLRAQWEIRGVAEQMVARLKAEAPALFRRAGPKCIALGRCPEGRLTCGRFGEVRARYLGGAAAEADAAGGDAGEDG